MKLQLLFLTFTLGVIMAKSLGDKLKKESVVDWETSYGYPQYNPGFYFGFPNFWNQPMYSRSLIYDPYQTFGFPETWSSWYES
ncbi:unnamed protein product [Pieris macdunnoughi]|uniref:Uncharacterized protein n=1 Tax=Pieris macdunnoughi TaxID=345717 RepID=A0A821SBB9_9NEOP|nr:unnamed protein product [Pieris macdunnoughi]